MARMVVSETKSPLDFQMLNLFTGSMKIYDITVNQLRRAAAIKVQIEQLNKELQTILGGQGNSRNGAKRSRPMSAATKKKIAAAQRARWAKRRRAKSTPQAAKSGAKA